VSPAERPAVPEPGRPGLFARLAELWASLWQQDPFVSTAGARGERLVAQIRLLVAVLLMATQLAPPGIGEVEHRVNLVVSVFIVLYALIVYWAVIRTYRRWMGVVTSVLDVTLVSLALAVFLWLGQPHTAVNSKILFELYYLVLAFAALRYDWRICAVAAGLAVFQYGALVAYASAHWDLNHPRYSPFAQGIYDSHQQIARLIMLVCAGVTSSAIVLRARSLRWLSSTDRLTGLLNRGAFDERLAEEASRATRHGRPFTIAIADIDHFKPFNDTYGHLAGDVALQRVADTLRRAVRRSDVVSRYGGEEFALLLPESRAEDALPRIEAIRRAVAVTPVRPTSHATGVTISIGVGCWPEDGDRTDEVFAAADRRLYQAKRAGRNRVVAGGTPRERQKA
jgi:diguanylate cyclase (GGDEF)-like protein